MCEKKPKQNKKTNTAYQLQNKSTKKNDAFKAQANRLFAGAAVGLDKVALNGGGCFSPSGCRC